MKLIFNKFFYHWRVLLFDRTFRISLVIGLLLFAGANIVNNEASVYNDTQTYLSVGDIILDNIPVVNLDFIFTWGAYFLILVIVIYPVVFRPEILPFSLKTFAILIFLRSGFILLTNIGPPVGFFYLDGPVGGEGFANFLFKNDLFFSGHTAYPFLAYLLFRNENKFVANFLLVGSFIEAFTVLFMHIHYSIDVFAAFFITYSTYAFSVWIFDKLILRFKNMIKLYGWDAIQKLKNLKSNIK